MENHTKVLFRYHSDVLEEETVETMWAETVDEAAGLYRLDNIPFYGPPIAPGDVFFAEWDADEQWLTFRGVRAHPGSSVVQIIVTDAGPEVQAPSLMPAKIWYPPKAAAQSSAPWPSASPAAAR